MLSHIKPEGILAIAPKYRAKISFQNSILASVDRANSSSSNDSTYLIVSGNVGTAMELAQIPVLVGLGNVTQTSVDILEIKLLDNSDNILDYEFDMKPGLFKLLGICPRRWTTIN